MTPEVRERCSAMSRWREENKRPYASLNADPEVMRHFPTLSPHQSDEMVDLMPACG